MAWCRIWCRATVPGLLIHMLRKSSGNGGKFASHQSLNKIHRDCEIREIEESAALDIGQIPDEDHSVGA